MSTNGTSTQSASLNTTKSQTPKSISTNDSLSRRRSSSRSIKRKKFDDEVVESSIIISKGRNKNLITTTTPSTPTTTSAPSTSVSNSLSNPTSTHVTTNTVSQSIKQTNSPAPIEPLQPVISTTTLTNQTELINELKPPTPLPTTTPDPVASSSFTSPAPTIEIAPLPVQPKKPKPITANKRRRYRNAHQNAVKDLGRWKPQDDLALVVSAQQLNDLEVVHRAVKFSCKFTLKEIENRWFGLLYDPTIAKIGVAAMRQLHPDIVAQIHAHAPYNEEEENLLKEISSISHPTIETFNDLLEKRIEVFLPYRKAKNLYSHWLLLKHYHLLNDQNVKNLNKLDEIPNFSDAEEQIENEMQGILSSNIPPSPASSSLKQEDIINQELALNNRKTKREIRQLENEIPKWQLLVDSITGVAPSDFDNETLAVLRGRLVRYLMRSREITLGRSTKDSIVDVDLSLEGPSVKISRKQALIKLNSNGDFLITNTGKRAFIVDSKPVLGNISSCKLNNNSVVEIAGLRFVFLINQDLIANVRAESFKKI